MARIKITNTVGTIWVTHVVEGEPREEGPSLPNVSCTNLLRDAGEWPMDVAVELLKMVKKRYALAELEE